jgi:hypothetical protein
MDAEADETLDRKHQDDFFEAVTVPHASALFAASTPDVPQTPKPPSERTVRPDRSLRL